VSSRPDPAGVTATVLFALPGPAVARETAAGWTQWRTTRHRFVPAPRLSLAQWQRLAPRRRMLHDLHERLPTRTCPSRRPR
jgi:hypothetical protein